MRRKCALKFKYPRSWSINPFIAPHYSLCWARIWLSSSLSSEGLIRQPDSDAVLRYKHERIFKDTNGVTPYEKLFLEVDLLKMWKQVWEERSKVASPVWRMNERGWWVECFSSQILVHMDHCFSLGTQCTHSSQCSLCTHSLQFFSVNTHRHTHRWRSNKFKVKFWIYRILRWMISSTKHQGGWWCLVYK